MDKETEEKFQHILTIRGRRLNWQKLPTFKDIMFEAIDLLYKKEKESAIDNKVKKEVNGQS